MRTSEASSPDVGEATRVKFNVDVSPASGYPMLVLLNMALMNLMSWEPLMAHMPSGFGYLRHDYRGTGLSAYDAEQSGLPDLDVLAVDVIRLLDAHRLDTSILVGSSFGARVALKMAVRFPDRVRALCLFDANIGMPPSTEEQQQGLERARSSRRGRGLPEVAVLPKWFRHADPKLSRRVFYTAKDISQIDVESLAGISVPTLVATGEFDSNLVGTRRIAATIPGAVVQQITSSSHGTIIQRPDKAAEILWTFLGEKGLAEF